MTLCSLRSLMNRRAGTLWEVRVILHNFCMRSHLNYYLSGAVCAVCISVCLRLRKTFPVIRFRWTDISNSRIQARRAWRLVNTKEILVWVLDKFKSYLVFPFGILQELIWDFFWSLSWFCHVFLQGKDSAQKSC